MQFSFHTCGFEGWPLEEVIVHLAKLGYSACGPTVGPSCHLDPDIITHSQLANIKTILADSGMKVALLNPWRVKGFANMAAEGTAERFYRKAMDMAAALDCPAVRFLSGALPAGDQPSWAASIRALRPLCHYGEQIGVALAMHNHENTMLDTADKLRLMSSWLESPALKVNLDPANLQILGNDPCDALRAFRDDLAQVRVKGRVGRYPYSREHYPGAAGDIVDWDSFFSTMHQIGYAGPVELVHYAWFPNDYAEACLAWAKSVEARVRGE